MVVITAGLLVMGLGGLATDIGPWYYALRQPAWQPPDWLFGPAWTLIYLCAGTAAVWAWEAPAPPAWRQRLLLLWAVNGLLNVAWSVLFFTLKRPDWALFEVPLLWLSILALVLHIAPRSRRAAALLMPYLLWVAFAATLNATIVQLNPA
jgi:translocator protein